MVLYPKWTHSPYVRKTNERIIGIRRGLDPTMKFYIQNTKLISDYRHFIWTFLLFIKDKDHFFNEIDCQVTCIDTDTITYSVYIESRHVYKSTNTNTNIVVTG